jgi:hypothetical protein
MHLKFVVEFYTQVRFSSEALGLPGLGLKLWLNYLCFCETTMILLPCFQLYPTFHGTFTSICPPQLQISFTPGQAPPMATDQTVGIQPHLRITLAGFAALERGM